jgi:hypothetical protein
MDDTPMSALFSSLKMGISPVGSEKNLDKKLSLIKMGLRFRYGGYFGSFVSGRNSVVECQLPKLDVAGSSPVARSIFIPSAPAAGKWAETVFFLAIGPFVC